MKFSEMEYKRVEYDAYRKDFGEILCRFTAAKSAGEQLDAVKAYFDLRSKFSTMYNLTYIRHTADTADAFYSAENDYYDENGPKFEALQNEFNKALLNSPFRAELEKTLGTLLFENAAIALRSFSDQILGDMAEENRLRSQYKKLIASAQIEFDGKTLNISQLGFYMNSADREVRRKAFTARSAFFLEHEQELDDIYDKLVKNRTLQAKKLGLKNYVELGYLRRTRNSYDSKAVADFRALVRQTLVPIYRTIREKQRGRLKVDHLMFYDEGTLFAGGNPLPEGTPEQIFENGRKMYRELSPQTNEFFDFMLENALFDVLGRKNKAAGGYCTEIALYHSPFIFANFNGTHDDINVLTHEAGHAFQYYTAREIYPPDYISPTYDACEIHSMSMEFFTWPWMTLFFGGKADKFRYMHLTDALTFIPYGCAVDEFQHIVYEHPELTPKERKEAWLKLEADYLPGTDYGDDAFLAGGGRWQRQLHIYEEPFYYIDYCLAQTCALEFWALARENRESAFEKYLSLCRLGGTDTFTGLLRRAGLENPFEEGCLSRVAGQARAYLDGFNESTLD